MKYPAEKNYVHTTAQSGEKLVIGDCRDSFDVLVDRASMAYSQGYNSLFVHWNGSYHDAAYDIVAQRRTCGRQVTNPVGWIAKVIGYNYREIARRKALSYAAVEENRAV